MKVKFALIVQHVNNLCKQTILDLMHSQSFDTNLFECIFLPKGVNVGHFDYEKNACLQKYLKNDNLHFWWTVCITNSFDKRTANVSLSCLPVAQVFLPV